MSKDFPPKRYMVAGEFKVVSANHHPDVMPHWILRRINDMLADEFGDNSVWVSVQGEAQALDD